MGSLSQHGGTAPCPGSPHPPPPAERWGPRNTGSSEAFTGETFSAQTLRVCGLKHRTGRSRRS